MRGRPEAVLLLAELISHPHAQHEVQRLLSDYRDRVRQEPGNLAFTPSTVDDDPTVFWVYEEYRDATAFEDHLASAHNRLFNDQVGRYLVGGAARLRILRPLEGSSRG